MNPAPNAWHAVSASRLKIMLRPTISVRLFAKMMSGFKLRNYYKFVDLLYV